MWIIEAIFPLMNPAVVGKTACNTCGWLVIVADGEDKKKKKWNNREKKIFELKVGVGCQSGESPAMGWEAE